MAYLNGTTQRGATPSPALHCALQHTLLYADLFDYPLTLVEAWRYLIGVKATVWEVRATLEAAVQAGIFTHRAGFYSLGNRSELAALRTEREKRARVLWRHARRWGAALAALPFVRMAAVTGALAMNNTATDDDDIDFLVLTAPGRVWLARVLCIGLVHVARRFGVELCPNYVLSATALEQSPRNLYIAHELAQMVPLSGHTLHAAMLAANEWMLEFLPNLEVRGQGPADGRRPMAQKLGEHVLANGLGDWLERWERGRKQRKFARQAARSAAVRLDADHVKGHFNDHGARVLAEYQSRLERYRVDEC